ncbi:MAG: SDR family NAD(P)-dependent oxidoreductase, partial [Rhodospirillales bacterium]|nr:SDR family NAD(P)-dependent oxidoreductase [Rhodospirillales bacterium]
MTTNDDPLKSVLVTGAARRIGRAIALDLAKSGWTVAIHYNRSKAEAAAVAEEISALGGEAVVVQADLALEEGAAGLVGQARDAIGPLSGLINNASVFEKDTPQTATKDSWESHMQVNLRAPFQLTQAFSKQLTKGTEGN